MRTIKLNSQYEMPQLGLGTWLSQPGEVYNIVKSAINDGYRHIDCAAIYNNEKEIGKAFSEIFNDGPVKREDVFITSKLWNNSHAPKNVRPALEKTLSDLQLDYLDLYLIHWPVVFKEDVMFPETPDGYIALENLPISDTFQEMEKAVESGLVKSIGVSNFSQKKLSELLEKSSTPPAVNQVELHPYLQQNNLVQFCKTKNIALTAYSPLGSSGRPPQMQANDEPLLLENETIKGIAEKHSKSTAQVVLNWALSRGTIAIPKTVTPSRAIENFKSQDFELDSDDMRSIGELDRHFRYVTGKFFTPEGSPYTLANLWDE